MATFLLTRPFLSTSIGCGLGIGLSLTYHPSSPLRLRPIQCQNWTAPYYNPHASPETGWALPVNHNNNNEDNIAGKQGRTKPAAQNKDEQGILTASTMRQLALGSVLGLVAGLGLRVFSKALVFVLGVGVVLIEWAAAKGYQVFPVRYLQKYIKSVDLQKAMRRNMPFKTSFGVTMAMAAFAQF